MDDLETQISRLADARAKSVDPIEIGRRENRPSRLWLTGAAAAIAVGLSAWVVIDRNDGIPTTSTDPPEAVTTTTEPMPATTTTVVEGSDTTAEDSERVDATELVGQFPPAPLAPRHSAGIVVIDDRVVVWGGHVEAVNIGRRDLDTTSLVDGAVFDTVTRTWSAMSDSPLENSSRVPAVARVASRALFARGSTIALYDPSNDRWDALPEAPLVVAELFVLGGTTIAAVSPDDEVAFLDAAERGGWERGERISPSNNMAWTSDGSRLIASSPELGQLEAFVPGQVAATSIVTDSSVEVSAGLFHDVTVIDDQIIVVPEGGPIWAYDETRSEWTTSGRELGASYEVEPVAEASSDGRLIVRAEPRVMIGGDPEPDAGLLSVPFPDGLVQRGSVLVDDAWWSFGLFVSDAGNELVAVPVPGRDGPVSQVYIGAVAIDLSPESERYAAFSVSEDAEFAAIARTGSNAVCEVAFWRTGAPEDEPGIARRFSDGSEAVATCTTGGGEQDLLDRLRLPEWLTDAPLVEAAPDPDVAVSPRLDDEPLTARGLGPLRIGESLEDLAAVGFVGLSDECGTNFTVADDGLLPLSTLISDTLDGIYLVDPRYRTSEGIGAGASRAHVLERYPEAVERIVPHAFSEANESDPEHRLEVVSTDPADGDLVMIFTIEEGLVSAIRVGFVDAIQEPYLCS